MKLSRAIDSAGKETTLIDAKGNIKTTTFDARNRPMTIQYADATRVTLQYDALSRRTTMVDSTGTTTYAYTDRGELSQKSLPGAFVLSMSYDAVGNRTLLIDPDAGRFTTTFDTLNRTSVVQDPDNKLTTQQYDADSRRTTLIDANGATCTTIACKAEKAALVLFFCTPKIIRIRIRRRKRH